MVEATFLDPGGMLYLGGRRCFKHAVVALMERMDWFGKTGSIIFGWCVPQYRPDFLWQAGLQEYCGKVFFLICRYFLNKLD